MPSRHAWTSPRAIVQHEDNHSNHAVSTKGSRAKKSPGWTKFSVGRRSSRLMRASARHSTNIVSKLLHMSWDFATRDGEGFYGQPSESLPTVISVQLNKFFARKYRRRARQHRPIAGATALQTSQGASRLPWQARMTRIAWPVRQTWPVRQNSSGLGKLFGCEGVCRQAWRLELIN